MDGRTDKKSPHVLQDFIPFGAAVDYRSSEAWEDYMERMDLSTEGLFCGLEGPIWGLKGTEGSLSWLIGDLKGLIRLVRADLRTERADLRFGRALKVTKSRRIQGFLGFIWKKVEDSKILRFFETCREIQFSLFLASGLGKLISFLGWMGLRMNLIAKKELIFFFQMVPSRILCNQYFLSYHFWNLFLFTFLFFCIFCIFPKNEVLS